MQIEPLNPNKQELHVLLPYDDLGRDATHGQGCAVWMYMCPGRQVRGRQVARLGVIDKYW